jgi:stress response protein YsnF
MTDLESLPHEAHIDRLESGWSIRLPLRCEEVRLEKRTVVGERVVIRRARVPDVARVQSSVNREQLRIEEQELPATDDLDATQPIEVARPHDTLAGTGKDQEPLR